MQRHTFAFALLLTATAACSPAAPPACPEHHQPSDHEAHAAHAAHDEHTAHDEHAAHEGHTAAPAAKASPSGEAFALAAKASDKAVHPTVLHEDADMKIAIVTIKPGATMAEHAAAVPVTVQTLSGKGGMTIAGKDNVLEPGKLYRMDAHAPHALKADDAAPLVVLLHYIKGGAEVGHHDH